MSGSRAGSKAVWRESPLFADLRQAAGGGSVRVLRLRCGLSSGGCMAAKFFTGLPLDGPDPECVHGHGEAALAAGRPSDGAGPPRPAADHSHPRVPVTIGRRPPQRDCDENPLAGRAP